MGHWIQGLVLIRFDVQFGTNFTIFMLKKSTLDFLSELKNNNNKPWFDEHRKAYEAAKKDFEQFTGLLIERLATIDADVAAEHLEPKQCVLRIFRDVRFSADKTPYKSNFFASFSKGGRKSTYAGYYFCLEPNGASFFGGGIYMPMPPELAKVRQEIAYEWAAWQEIIESADFKRHFSKGIETTSSLSRPPQGYEAEHPAMHYLKMKGYFTSCDLADTAVLHKDLADRVANGFQAIAPLVKFVNRALE
jgi:uncharacterized protein (TIGR02453 family)